MRETIEILKAALADGSVNDQEVVDLVARGRNRTEHERLRRISEAKERGLLSEAAVASLEMVDAAATAAIADDKTTEVDRP